MSDLILTTYDWVPEMPRGLVRDLRVRWALEEAGLPYRVESTPFRDRGPEHFAAQPFGQVPWLTDGDLTLFESGAILLHLADKSPALMPQDARVGPKSCHGSSPRSIRSTCRASHGACSGSWDCPAKHPRRR
ncbi:glutathione S-transferase N-terminal domain-containing protein [Sphingobium sp. LMC3-1-1.1]|uniref:glutathione S-transferase N-terminal domain-containing protein n=1 Tax=Sphingobium sp. LMC3-1-1.1 TaxID=3135241 RepID=UPI003418A93A